MKILLTIHHHLDPDSGAPGSVLKLGQMYQALGHEVQYYSFDDLPAWAVRISPEMVFPEFLAQHLLKYAAHFDVIDASTGDAWIWGAYSRRRDRPLLVTRSHGLEHTDHLRYLEEARQGKLHLSRKYFIYRGGFHLWEVAMSLRCADLAFLLNQQDRQYAIDQLDVQPDCAFVIPNGIPDYFLNLAFEPLSEQDSTIGIAQIGTYIPRKGVQYSVPALNQILSRHSQVKVSFLGTGCPEDQVYADFDARVRDRVKVIPRFQHDQLPTLVKGHYIQVFPSISEGFGKALIEGMACGLAPITTATPGPLEIVRDGQDAIVVPIRDSQAIEQTLEKLLANRSYLEQLRQNAYQTAQHYSWMRCAQKRLGLYETGLGRKHA
jgi:glycosyltransferase involved in cell wall biosynthesis